MIIYFNIQETDWENEKRLKFVKIFSKFANWIGVIELVFKNCLDRCALNFDNEYFLNA